MTKAINYLLLLVFLIACKATVKTAHLEGEKQQRSLKNINNGWDYLEDNMALPKEAKAKKNWKTINLPHTWNQWDIADQVPGYRRDASWYKKNIVIQKNPEARYSIYFEGSNITTQLYVNDQFVGMHIGGYVGFEMDITAQLKTNGNNEIAVRVDNSYNKDIIPSQKADFFIYGGIVRDVWLKTLPKTHITTSQISTPTVSELAALTEVKIILNNECDNCVIQSSIIDPTNGKSILQTEAKILAKEAILKFEKLDNPILWSPSSPTLYTVRIRLIQGGKIIDEVSDKIGYRFYHFEDNGPFYLNGVPLKLRGTHRHEEHAGYGAAMTNEMHRSDIKLIKEVGANFLRLGHYPQDPEIYRACDELGIIVWDELPWCRGGMGEETWKNHTRRLLKEQIRQNYNHPSIFFWSLGNEIYWLPDFSGGDDRNKINTFLKELNTISHQEDPYRMTAIRKYYAGADIVDVFSPSIWSGWYAGVYTNYEQTIKENLPKYKRFLHMEYGGSSHVGRHTETPITGEGTVKSDDWEEVSNQVEIENIAKNGDWTENYIVDLFDWHLQVSEQEPRFAGNAQWAFKDFGTPLRPENAIPYINQKGLVDRAGKPKDAFYVFQSYWSDKPMIYIESHTWTDRRGPEGKKRALSVYSNCDEVELFHNGQSLGKKTRNIKNFPACGLTWDILFKEGKNDLMAKGYVNEELEVEDQLNVNYSYKQVGKVDHLALSSTKLDNGNYLITATVQDRNNNRILNYEDRIYFHVLNGTGEMLKYYGTPNGSDIIEMANGQASIELIPGTGKTNIEVRGQNFKGTYLSIDPSTSPNKNK